MSGDNEQLTSDLTKANEILHRKIDEIKQIKEKYKRNAEIIKRQEEILNQKDQDLKVRAKLSTSFVGASSKNCQMILIKQIFRRLD